MTRYGDNLEISNSEVQTFMDCRRRWWLTYYRGLKPRAEPPVGPLKLGARVHRALEEGYSTPGRGEAALALLAASIEADYPLAESFGGDVLKKFESEAELAVIMLTGFIDWAAEEGLDAGWEIVAEERIVKAPPLDVSSQPVILKGKLDQIIRREMDGALMMRDWKTTQDKDPVMIAFGPQLKTYLAILALTEPDAQVGGGQFVFLRKVKRSAKAVPPFYWMTPVYVFPREMGTFWDQLTATLERIVGVTVRLDGGGDHQRLAPPRPTRDCGWRCPFFNECPMFDDGSRVEELIESKYTTGDPYEYYGIDADETKEIE